MRLDPMRSLPQFKPNREQREWIAGQLQTAQYVHTLWNAASPAIRRQPEFLTIIVRAGWLNDPGTDGEATRRWRNTQLQIWLGLPGDSDENAVAVGLTRRLGLPVPQARWLTRTTAGITHYYAPLRTAALKAIRQNSGAIHAAFKAVSQTTPDPIEKVRRVGEIMDALPPLVAPAGGSSSLLNAVSPALACLDPQRCFPVMNSKTQRLLTALGKVNNAEGAQSLAGLIGQLGIRHAFDLDVYANTHADWFPRRQPGSPKGRLAKPIGTKDEEDGIATLAKNRVVIRRIHNKLINQFRSAVEWRQQLLESECDVLINDWRAGRKLIVEAKTSTTGCAGRTQLRQAIGQLFDYRWRRFKGEHRNVDLALLVPTKPSQDILDLLENLGIEALWFGEGKLKGTIALR